MSEKREYESRQQEMNAFFEQEEAPFEVPKAPDHKESAEIASAEEAPSVETAQSAEVNADQAAKEEKVEAGDALGFFEAEEEAPHASEPASGKEAPPKTGRKAKISDAEKKKLKEQKKKKKAEERAELEKEYAETPSHARRVLLALGGSLLVLVLLIIFFSDRLYNRIEGTASYILTESGVHIGFSQGNTTVGLLGPDLLRCSQDGIQAVNQDGRVDWDIPFSMSSPYMVTAGNCISVADRLGMSLVTIQNGQLLSEITTESNIQLNAVSEGGSAAVVLEAADGHIVNLYSAQGSLLLQRRTYSSVDGVPMAIALSASAGRLATVYVDYSGAVLRSYITVFDLTESGSTKVDRIIGSLSYDDVVISDLKFVGDRLVFIGNDRMGAVLTQNGCELLWEQRLSYELESVAMAEEYMAIRYGGGLAGTAEDAKYNIVLYNYQGEIICEKLMENATYLDAWTDVVIIGTGRSYVGMNTGGTLLWSLDSVEDYSRLVAFRSGKKVAAVRRDGLTYYDVTLKTPQGEEETP